MARRMTDSTKWSKPFLRAMEAPYKLLWIYILDECDHAGIWQVDLDVAQLKIGETLEIESALYFFGDKISVIDGGQKWFINDFIDFQYGELNPANKVHNSAIKILNKYNLLDENLNIKPLASPLQAVKDKDKEKDKDKIKDKDKEKPEEKPKNPELIFPFTSPEFLNAWNILATSKKWKNKSPSSLQASLKKLSKVSEIDAITMIENCIAGEWMGLVELKPHEKHGNTTFKSTNQLKSEINQLGNAATEYLRSIDNGNNVASHTG